jgi:hypothetical protein
VKEYEPECYAGTVVNQIHQDAKSEKSERSDQEDRRRELNFPDRQVNTSRGLGLASDSIQLLKGEEIASVGGHRNLDKV